MIPPTPPEATIVAEQKARFHWPTILLCWYVRECGMFEKAAPTMRKAPKYLTPLGLAKPSKQIPTISMRQLRRKNGARRLNLSDNQPSVTPKTIAKQ